jgi:crotonobetainyl-CoA:carnitine CoA-transferase CaiB-like acyl-CoA transferase
VHTPKEASADPHFAVRLPWLSSTDLDADMLPLPINSLDDELRHLPERAPSPGDHTDEVLTELGYDEERIKDLRATGAIG